jgi:glyoxylase-like metal-dependent hydrolase (beta-lactamase superfamily II)
MDELRPGLWTWTVPHPDWTADQGGPEGWERDVRSCAVATGEELVLLDPMELPEPAVALAEGRAVSVVLTCAWHRRSAEEWAERFGAPVHAPAAGIERLELPAEPYEVGDELPGGVRAVGAYYPEEIILWVPDQRTLFAGDAFTSPPLRFQRSWLPDGFTVDEAIERLRPLADLPAEVVVVGHGEPATEGVREALAKELEA